MQPKVLGKTEITEPVVSEDTTTDKLAKYIPKELPSALGDKTPYADFKTTYQSVYDQVRDMDHLLLGRITYSGKIAGKVPFTLQTLKQSELALVHSFAPMTTVDNLYYTRDMAKFVLYKVTMALSAIKDRELPTFQVTFETTQAEWEEKAKGKISMLADYDESVIALLSNIYDDMTTAKQLAFIELMPRP